MLSGNRAVSELRSPLFSFCFVYSMICCDGYKLEHSFFEPCFSAKFFFQFFDILYCQPILKWNIFKYFRKFVAWVQIIILISG